MTITAALLTGAVVGLRHALEADHLAAISTLVGDGKANSPGLVGVSWGIGHSIPVICAGLLFVFSGTTLPGSVILVFEVLAGAVLVCLGLRMLLDVAGVVDTRSHTHDGDTHTHVTLGSVLVGTFHAHADSESLLVGVIHGLAGSGAIVVALAATASSTLSSLSLLGSFALVTVLTMGVLAVLWGTVLTTRLKSALKAVAGGASLWIGGALVASELAVSWAVL